MGIYQRGQRERKLESGEERDGEKRGWRWKDDLVGEQLRRDGERNSTGE